MTKLKKNSPLQFNLRRVISFSRYFILAAAAALLFLWPTHNIAYAEVSTMYEQSISDTTMGLNSDAKIFVQKIGSALEGTLSEICFYINAPTGNIKFDISTSSYNENTVNPAFDPAIWYGNASLSVPTTGKALTCVSIPELELNPDFNYYIKFGYNASVPTIYGAAVSAAWRTSAEDFTFNSVSYEVKDIYFELNGYPINPNSIQITYPLDGTALSDFAAYGFSGFTENILTNIQINVGSYSSSSFPIFQTNYIIDGYGDFAASSTKVSALPPGQYWAKAYLETCPAPYNLYSDCIPSVWTGYETYDPEFPNGYFEVQASSTPIVFIILPQSEIFTGSSTMGYYYSPTSTISTSTPIQITCDPNDPLFQRSLCKLYVFLFVPSPDVLNTWATIAEPLKTKAPIGYFYSFAQALGGFNTTSTPAFVLTGLASLVNITGPLDVGLTIIIYIVLAIWTFNRIRHLDL